MKSWDLGEQDGAREEEEVGLSCPGHFQPGIE